MADPLAQASGPRDLSPPERRPWRFEGFPIVAWWGPPGTATRGDFEAYRDAGFTLHATNPDRGFEQALRHVEAVGLKSLVFRQHQGFELDALPGPRFPEDRESVVGWIVADEPTGQAQVSRSIETVKLLLHRDPSRWAFFNLLSPQVQGTPSTEAIIEAAVRAGMPIVSYDSYVIMADGSDRADLFYANLERVRQASLTHNVPFWPFALTIQHYMYRRPSESDLRWQHFSNLAYGAKGLWYFTYWGPTNWRGWDSRAIVDPRDGSRTELYEWVKTLNHAVLAMGDRLLRLKSVDVVHSRPSGVRRGFEGARHWIVDVQARDALVGFFEGPDGSPHALVVNKLHGPGKSARETTDLVRLTFAERVQSVEAVSWLDGRPGSLQPERRSVVLPIAGGTGVLLSAEISPDD